MIDFLSSWAKGIGVTVVIISIFEMILPSNNSKKYIRMILGIYLIFNIVSPLIQNKEIFNIKNIDLEQMTTTSSMEFNQTSMNSRIKDLYEEELEKDITKKLKDKGYEVITCKVITQISTKKDEETKINKIKLKIKKLDENDEDNENKENQKSTEEKIVSNIQKIKQIDTTIKKDKKEEIIENENNNNNNNNNNNDNKTNKNDNRKITRSRY